MNMRVAVLGCAAVLFVSLFAFGANNKAIDKKFTRQKTTHIKTNPIPNIDLTAKIVVRSARRLKVEIKAKNLGSAKAPVSRALLRFTITHNTKGVIKKKRYFSIPALAGGETKTVSLSLVREVFPGSKIRLELSVDDDKKILERNERNNRDIKVINF